MFFWLAAKYDLIFKVDHISVVRKHSCSFISLVEIKCNQFYIVVMGLLCEKPCIFSFFMFHWNDTKYDWHLDLVHLCFEEMPYFIYFIASSR